MVSKTFESNENKEIDRFGDCPECGANKSKIVWGWHGVYYDMECPNGHVWTYGFKENK